MNPALWGSLSALSLGTADFAGRFSGRALGADVAYFGVLLVGTIAVSVWVWAGGETIVGDISHLWLVAVCGVATALMTILLYTGLGRGPVSVVAPIVASHPVLVLVFWVMVGARPGLLQWVAMLFTIVGVVVVARSGERLVNPSPTNGLRTTLFIAAAACLAHAVLVIAGQSAVPVYGNLQTLWLTRLFGLVFLGLYFVIRVKGPLIPVRWWPLILAQGALDAAGYLFLFAGSSGDGREITAVTASAFGAVTTILARVFLKERMRMVQWVGVMFIFGGIAVLSA